MKHEWKLNVNECKNGSIDIYMFISQVINEKEMQIK